MRLYLFNELIWPTTVTPLYVVTSCCNDVIRECIPASTAAAAVLIN